MNFVVDTNVAYVASGKDGGQANPCCRKRCISRLREIRSAGKHRVVLDDGRRIAAEYSGYLKASRGEPGAGELFLKWALSVSANPKHCLRVTITPDPQREYVEFPGDPALRAFDRSDRKFAAAAVKAGPGAEILNAVDSDWRHFALPLAAHNIVVRELC